jgi:hypothetical protein
MYFLEVATLVDYRFEKIVQLRARPQIKTNYLMS